MDKTPTRFTYVEALELEKLKLLGEVKFDSAASGTAVDLFTLPEGAILTHAICVVSAGFDAATTNVLTLGTADAADVLMADADITDGTPGAYHKDCWLVGAEGGTVIKGTYSQTGAAAAHGAATFYGRIADKLS